MDTVIIEIAATDPNPGQAARIADAVATELAKAARDLTPSLANGSEAVRAAQRLDRPPRCQRLLRHRTS